MAKDTQTYREDEGSPEGRYTNGQVKQAAGQDLAPADGGDGFVGSNTGPALGMNVVSGKKGYSTDRPIWSEQSSFTETPDNTGSTGNAFPTGGQDPTDEKASYKRVQTDEGLPQTYRNSKGAGDAGPTGSDEMNESTGPRPETQSVPSADSGDHEMSDMPQTGYTHSGGDGAPLFKRGA